MSYQQVFGGTTIYPSDVSYLALTLNADKALEWPLESNDPSNPAARIIDVTTSGSYSVTLPDATQTGAGQTILFNNLPASTNSFLVKDYSGSTIATVGVGEQWQVYLSDTSTAAGTWRVFRYGASTATVQASALAGYGLTVTSNTLSQSLPVTTFNTSPRTLLATDRASALVWTGTGTGTLNLIGAATVGNNFFIAVRNSGGGDLTVDAAGSETIDGAPTLALRPGESTNLLTDGLTWYTLGLGQEAVFAFDYTSISVTGGTYTLAGSELNRIAYKFVGTLAADQYVVVPSTVQQYWVDNATTGAYNFYLQTSGGTPVGVGQGTRGIYYCNGTNVVDADTATISLPVGATDGGTGITSYTTGDLLYANSATTLAKLSDVAVGNVLRSGGVGVAPAWGKVVLTTDVSGTLPVANGGTGTSTAFTSGSVVFAGASGVYSQDNANLFWDDTNNRLGVGTSSPTEKLDISGGAGNSSVSVQVASANPSINLKADATNGFYPTINFYGAGASGGLVGSVVGYDGVYLEAAGNRSVVLRTNGSERLRVDGSGNVGIGTSAPNSFAGYTYITTAGTNGSGIYFRQGATNLGLVDVYGNAMHVFSQGAHPLALGTDNTERMRISSTGNVSIGNTNNTFKLDVSGAAAIRGDVNISPTAGADGVINFDSSNVYNYLYFRNAGTTFAAITGYLSNGLWQTADQHIFRTNYASPTERMRITSAGNVGIGTTAPDANGKVDILGNIDPGTTPAALSVRNTGVAGGTASAQYGIRVSSQTYNNATASYGIYAFSHQNVGNTTYGIWGDAGSPTQVGSSAQPFYGVTGRAYFNSAASHGLTNGTLPVGVYGTVVSTGSTNTAISAAGYFTNAATFGSEAYGIYVNVATGPTTTIAARFDFAGTEVARIDSAGGILSRGTGGIGYRTGAGGTVTQATSRTTGVTLNTVTGSITLVSAAGTATWQSFTVTNSAVAANDVVIVSQRSGADLYLIHVTNVAAGSFRITFATTGGTTTEQPVFNFAVIKGATS